jgi:hypothetical protein
MNRRGIRGYRRRILGQVLTVRNFDDTLFALVLRRRRTRFAIRIGRGLRRDTNRIR